MMFIIKIYFQSINDFTLKYNLQEEKEQYKYLTETQKNMPKNYFIGHAIRYLSPIKPASAAHI